MFIVNMEIEYDHDLTCGICLIDIPDTYMECFHKVCSTCVKLINRCPFCRFNFSREFSCTLRSNICPKNKQLLNDSLNQSLSSLFEINNRDNNNNINNNRNMNYNDPIYYINNNNNIIINNNIPLQNPVS